MSRPALFALLSTFWIGCAVSRAPAPLAPVPIPQAGSAAPTADWVTFLQTPGPLVHTASLSAEWAVPLSGLLDLDDPLAADLPDKKTAIALPVHVLAHPQHGTWVIDTGIDSELADGKRGGTRGMVRAFTGSMVPKASLRDLLGGQAPDGVLLTHAHLDHILGLPDVPADTPVYMGPGELDVRAGSNMVLRRTMRQLLGNRPGLRTWDLADAVPLGPIPVAWDALGDGSLWVLSTPGHTPGSISVLARTTTGPVLFTGDTCHTLWGWENGVPPGKFTLDADTNRASLDLLKSLDQSLDGLQVYVGHELDGEGTGVEIK